MSGERISEILWNAANKHLLLVKRRAEAEGCKSWQSCCAAAIAEDPDWAYEDWTFVARNSKTVQFLALLGCDPSVNGSSFDEFDEDSAQQARYAWLMFASMYAEEQGL